MNNRFSRIIRTASLASVAAFAMSSQSAMAQDNDAEADDQGDDIIFVTGTLIRGVEVTGSQTIDIGVQEITESGASTTNELLGDLPQIGAFNNRFDNDPRGADRQQVSRPNLRNLPGVTAATGATTLVLVDGHRMVPMGVDQASFDPDFISPGGIERVEVVTDGGSSLYGADAVGGVVNLITRRGFEGIEVTGGYDVGDSYDAWNLGFTAGTSWNSGSAFVSYATFQRDEILNNARDYGMRGSWNVDGTVLSPSGTECIVPVGEITTWANFGSGWTDNPLAASLGVRVTPVGSPCDIDGESAMLPELERHSVLFGVTQELSDSLTLDIKANFGDSSVRYSSYPLGDTIAEPNPNELMIPGVFFDTYDVAAVGFSYGAHSSYVDRQQELDLRVYGITPELTWDIGGGWQAKNTLYWGRSENSRSRPLSDRTKLLDYIASGDVDVTNIAAADAGVIADILNFESAGEAEQELFLFRTVVDGPLFEMPGGPVRAAVGFEYNNDSAKLRDGSFAVGALSSQAFRENDRDVISVFGELSIPIFSMLDLSLSGRYDDYSDFGGTFNPGVGLNFEPFDGFRVYGSWSESFNAPTALDGVRTANARFIANAAPGVPDPNGELTGPNDDVLLVEGSGGGLQPQEAETWTVGAEFEPVSNLVLSVNYYNIDFTNLLGAVNPQLASVVLLNPDKFIFNPTQGEFDAFLAASANGAQFADIDAADVGIIIDRRVANIGAASLEGVDFSLDYWWDTGIGELNFRVAGNKQLNFDITENGNTVDQLEFDVPDLAVSTSLGWASDGWNARATVTHTNGFDTNIAVNQTEVGSFTLANFYVGYEFPEGSGFTDGLTLRLNVDNVFDTEPPVYRQQRNLNYSGFTLGRVFKFGITKRI